MQLVIDRLSKTYPNGVQALHEVSLTIPQGMFGLLGPNGAGKSTLMRILATLQDADSGAARLGETDVLREREAVRRTLGYLPQEFGLYPRVAAEDLLDHFAILKGITDAKQRRQVVHALLAQTNLWDARRQKLGGFSGGMRQRFGIAVALIGDPRLIIVDEPTAGLDPAERVRFLNLLSELGERAVVILSTHIVEDVSDLCTRMAIIDRGRIRLEGEPLAAIQALRGRVWRRVADRHELPALEAALPVISQTLYAGRTVVHVHGDAPPDASFEPVEPDLKDVYFTVMKGIPVWPAAAPPATVHAAGGGSTGDAGEAAPDITLPPASPPPHIEGDGSAFVASAGDPQPPVSAEPRPAAYAPPGDGSADFLAGRETAGPAGPPISTPPSHAPPTVERRAAIEEQQGEGGA